MNYRSVLFSLPNAKERRQKALRLFTVTEWLAPGVGQPSEKLIMKRLMASAFFFLGGVSLLQAQTKPLVLPLGTDNVAPDFSATSAAKATFPEFVTLSSSFLQLGAGPSLTSPPALNTALSAGRSAADPTPVPDPRFVYGGREDYRWQINLSLAWLRFQSTPFNSNAVGVKSTVTYFLNEWLGVEGSFTGAFAGAPSGFRNDAKLALYGGGPKIAWRQKRWEPWLHGIFGGAHALPQTAAGGKNSYSITVGGGADYRANPRISYRMEADYVRTGFYSQSQNNFLLAGGIVFHF